MIDIVQFSKKKLVWQWVMIFAGCFLISVAFAFFITPYKIIPGGVYGLGIVLNHIFPGVMVGTFGLLLDIPLLLIAMRIFGAKFGLKTIVCGVLTPVMMNILTVLVGSDPATMLGGAINLSDDVLLSCLFGGLLLGTGLALIFKTHATSGGTDIVAMIVTRYTGINLARSILLVDSAVVMVGLAVFGDWRIPLYSIVTVFVASKMIDYLIEGASTDKLLFILSDRNEEIKKLILEDMDRGGTFIRSQGMYTAKDRDMIFVVVSRREVTLVLGFIKKVDPAAFVVVVDANETLGDGFKTFNDKFGE